MAKDLDNYLKSIQEHIDLCVNHLADYSEKLSSGMLSAKDYFAIERLVQLIIESGIGLAKHLIKAHNQPTRSSAYENFKCLKELGLIDQDELNEWQSMIGLRNILVHEYLDINHEIINSVLRKNLYMSCYQFCNKMIKQLNN